MVPNGYSPDDPKLESYWQNRKHTGVESNLVTTSDVKIARFQRHTCPWCLQSLYNRESLEKHHIISVRNGGSNTYDNLVWLHKTCHQAVTRKKDDEFSEIIRANLIEIKKVKFVTHKTKAITENE